MHYTYHPLIGAESDVCAVAVGGIDKTVFRGKNIHAIVKRARPSVGLSVGTGAFYSSDLPPSLPPCTLNFGEGVVYAKLFYIVKTDAADGTRHAEAHLIYHKVSICLCRIWILCLTSAHKQGSGQQSS